MPPLHDLRFRANPLMELTQLASLTDAQREPFRDLESDPDFYGLFVPQPPLTITIKSAPRQTAELFRSLAAPAHLDRALLGDGDAAANIVDLVLDGILEIERGDGFVSGADALPFLSAGAPDAGGVLSRRALLHAQELETADPRMLASALYRYNCIPLTPSWRSRFAGPEAILAHVGAGRGVARKILNRDWSFSGETRGWLAWTPLLASRDASASTYKLYVSPRPERIRDAFEILVRVLAAAPAPFKLGNSAAGLLRADKLVAYFSTREQLDGVASAMRRELAGCEAQGVPFAAALDESGLLSWGVDPPESERVLRWQERDSWRFWIAQRLGGAMAFAKSARTSAAAEPWRFAVARIQRLGVDVATWTPSAALWRPS